MGNVYKIFVEMPERKRSLGRQIIDGRKNIKIGLK
jgi:hypothetical protein